MISLPRFDLQSWVRGTRHAWLSTTLWVGPVRVSSNDCNDSEALESSLIADIHDGRDLDEWYVLGFLCTCGSCTRCDPPKPETVLTPATWLSRA